MGSLLAALLEPAWAVLSCVALCAWIGASLARADLMLGLLVLQGRKRVAYDPQSLRNWSPALGLQIVLRTIAPMLRGDEAAPTP